MIFAEDFIISNNWSIPPTPLLLIPYLDFSINLFVEAADLQTLRTKLKSEAVEIEHDAAVGAIAAAEKAAKDGDGVQALAALSNAGKWAFDNASKIGVGVATAALKVALGL